MDKRILGNPTMLNKWMEELKDVKYPEPKSKDWIEFGSNPELFNMSANKNCLLLFDDGTICRYNDELPIAICTHFKIEE